MFKKLAIPFLTLTLVALGACSSDSNNNSGTGGKAGTGGAGTGGASGTGGAGTGGAGTGGAGTGGAGTGGAAVDAPVDMSTTETATETAAETMTEAGGDTTTADICAAYTGNGMLAGISATDFCMKYSTVCTFGGSMRFANMGACVTSYDAAATSAKTCRAGHLCNAAMPGNATVHCPHAMGDGTVCQ